MSIFNKLTEYKADSLCVLRNWEKAPGYGGIRRISFFQNKQNMEIHTEPLHWYALKVFFNKVFDVEQLIARDGQESYIPCETVTVEKNGRKQQERRPLVSSLMFVHSTQAYAVALQSVLLGRVMLYTHIDGEGRKKPSVISDYEMNMFRLVVSSGEEGLDYFCDSDVTFSIGERVRVIEGPFKGAEGRIRRIKGQRRLVVAITGVCAVATSFIPKCFLMKIQ